MSQDGDTPGGEVENQVRHGKTHDPEGSSPPAARNARTGDALDNPQFPATKSRQTNSTSQRLVFTDPIAFRYLQDDPCTDVVHSDQELIGYELYLVEQWACSRVHPTFIITIFTGSPEHKVRVGVLSLPTDETEWSPRLRVYLKAVSNFHARKKETSLGTLMVTNLSSFPSALTVIAVPGGDLKDYRENFIVNENLKRLGCSGRAGLNLSPPSGATSAKFLQIYRTSDRAPIPEAVVELVKLCQIALVMFTRLAQEYADGLLCDLTERAINDWWTKLGIEYFGIEPSDGILGPSTVAALLGLYLGARNRLNAFGAPVGKDAFDLRAMKRGIEYFQKSQKLAKSRRLDRPTLDRLHRTTSKAANSEGWMVPRAVKSTVAELGGKGGEMVMGMVVRDKTGIAEVETLDYRKFIETVSGERCKWLWHGKPKKPREQALDEDTVFSGDDHTGIVKPPKRKGTAAVTTVSSHAHLNQPYSNPSQGSQTSLDVSDKDQAFRKAVFKSVTGRMSDARSGLGRFKDVVGLHNLRTHQHKHSRDLALSSPGEQARLLSAHDARVAESERSSTFIEHQKIARQHTEEQQQSPTPVKERPARVNRLGTQQSQHQERKVFAVGRDNSSNEKTNALDDNNPTASAAVFARQHGPGVADEDHAIGGTDPPWPLEPALYSSTQSLLLGTSSPETRSISPRLTRQTSFGACEEAFLFVDDNRDILHLIASGDVNKHDLWTVDQVNALRAKKIASRLRKLEAHASTFLTIKYQVLESLEANARKTHEDLRITLSQKVADFTNLQKESQDLLREEETSLADAFKDMEVLAAKLEYELNAMIYKIEDVEVGVSDFERQVVDLEERTVSLGDEESYEETWPWRLWRFVAGYAW